MLFDLEAEEAEGYEESEDTDEEDFTADIDLGLRTYELTNDEWEIAEQLRDVLKVSAAL